jgi:hypothetical protein
MKFDYSTNPPTAWKVEDGDWVTIDPRYVMQIAVCQKYFINTILFNDSDICSTSCRLKKKSL